MTTPTEAARIAGISHDTTKRWLELYADFFSPSAKPPKGYARVLSDQDLRLLLMIASLRNEGLQHKDITDRLREAQLNDWRDLPPLPMQGETIALDTASNRAREIAEVAVLRTELNHLRTALEAAENRVKLLEDQLQHKEGIEAQNIGLQLELERARSEVARLEGQLSAYSFGREKPINVGLIIAGAILIGVVIVLAAVVVGALVG